MLDRKILAKTTKKLIGFCSYCKRRTPYLISFPIAIHFFFKHIVGTFKKQQTEYLAFEVTGINATSKDIGAIPLPIEFTIEDSNALNVAFPCMHNQLMISRSRLRLKITLSRLLLFS